MCLGTFPGSPVEPAAVAAGAAAEALCCCALHLGSCHACSQLLSFINASSARSFTISLTVLSFSAPVRSQTLVALLKFFGISAGVLSRVFSTRSRLATMLFHKQHETNNYLVMIILR